MGQMKVGLISVLLQLFTQKIHKISKCLQMVQTKSIADGKNPVFWHQATKCRTLDQKQH